MSVPASIHDNVDDYDSLRKAVSLLESPSLMAKVSGLIGSPIETAVSALPQAVASKINGAVSAALHSSAKAALWSLDNKPGSPASTFLHKAFAATSGAVGGAFGFAALFVELPVSTTIIMRSVADIARSEGFNLEDFATKQACVEVFALGGNSEDDDATETGYYVTRGFTAQTMQQLSKELAAIAAKQGTQGFRTLNPGQAGVWLAALIEKVAERFGITISSKFAAQAVPVIGAVTGAAINTLFIHFYQDMARGHFIVKRLEKTYGEEAVKQAYVALANKGKQRS